MKDFLTRLMLVPVRLLGQLPPQLARALVRPVGGLARLALPSRRRIAERNIELCFPGLAQREQKRIVRDHFRFLAEMLADSAMAWCRPGRLDERFGNVRGLEHVQAVVDEGQGVLLLTGHSPSLEMGGRLVGERQPAWGVYRPQRNRVLEEFQNAGRRRYATGMFSRDELRGMVRHLRAGGVLWYAPDQDFGPQRSLFVPFFNQPAATATGIVGLARMGRARVLPMYPLRDRKTGRVEVIIEPPLENFANGDDASDLARYNAFLESCIRQDPAQYFWVHRRFKSTPPGQPDRYSKKHLSRKRRARQKKKQ
ncbi:MAG TPA: lipid A biosynthesis lauroyl acyltransferase [Wenzhouxiangella sp.]|nr:lipid A biosynthesis lauroyl acyltransferase [Wenzhouxiangella sp.]